MSTPNKINARQIISSDVLSKIATAAGTTVQDLLKSLNSEVTSPFQMTAAGTLVVSIGSSRVANPITSYTHTVSPIGGDVPSFTSGTVTFPSTSGGTATVSPGNSSSITVASGQFLKVTIYLDSAGALNLLTGTAGSTEALATTTAAPSGTIGIGYVTLQNVGGVIQNITAANVYQFVGTGSGGSGSGSGTGDDLDSLQFRASFNDSFPESAIASTSSVNATSPNTNAVYSAAKAMWTMNYDANKTVTATGTAFTLSAAPAFTIAAGDMIIVPGNDSPKKILTLSSQTAGTVESAWATNPAAAACCISQAVVTKDIYNATIDGAALSAAFGGSTFSEVMVDYKDNATTGSNLFTPNTTPSVAFSASPDNTTFTTVQLRATNETDIAGDTLLPSAGTGLFLRFFSNKTTGAGVVNLIKYRAFMQKTTVAAGGASAGYAYGFLNGVGTPVNSSVSVVGGKSTITLVGFQIPVGVNAAGRSPYGSAWIIINGGIYPRFIDSTLTPDGYYKETSPTTITLDKDYSSLNLSYTVLYLPVIIDSSTQNVSNIAALQEISAQGSQGFVNTANQLSPSTTTGTPSVGTFQTTIANRAKIVDITQDLRGSIGTDRVLVQQLIAMQNEYGPNGEVVYGVTNDDRSLMRFVGVWSANPDAQGNRATTTTSGAYAEITFYGTGLNLLGLLYGSALAATYQVDGGTANTLISSIAYNSGMTSRNYSLYQIVPVVSGLTLGVHTVRINNAAAQQFDIEGIEVVGPSATINVNPGIAYAGGQKLVLSAAQALSYNTGFESGTLGSRGGHVAVYQKADGTIAKALTPTNASAAFLTAADHTNEESSRPIHFREFGANRTDDFSLATSTSMNLGFTMDDNTTYLEGNTVSFNGAQQAILLGASSAGYVVLTFVGTGIDIVRYDNGTTIDAITYTLDGNVIGTSPTTGFNTSPTTIKIASGLPYGSHTLQIARTTGSQSAPGVQKFLIYQPKKPAIPTGAVELFDYNLSATYVANATAGILNSATGIIKKSGLREWAYVGTGWAVNTDYVHYLNGQANRTNTTNDYFTYTFWGTGFDFRMNGTSGAVATMATVSVDGVSNLTGAGYTTSFYGSSISGFNGATGVISTSGTTTYASGVIVTGLPLGIHTVKVLNNQGTYFLEATNMDIITPVHIARPNSGIDMQNTLMVGNGTLSDNRKFSPIKDAILQKKNVSQAFGIVGTPTTTSTSYVPCPDMSVAHFNTSGRVRITWKYQGFPNSAMNLGGIIYMDGVAIPISEAIDSVQAASYNIPVGACVVVNVAPGYHKFDIYWNTSGGTLQTFGTQRNLLVEEI